MATKSEKQKAVELYGDAFKVEPVTDFQKKWIRKHNAKFIYINRDNIGKCEFCDSEIEVPKSKHKREIKCPCCQRKLIAYHTWRTKGVKKDSEWVAIPKIINDHTIMLRYVLDESKENVKIEELARMVIDLDTKKTLCLERPWGGKWVYGTWNFFRESNMGTYRKICCLQADEYTPLWFREIKKLKAFKYLDIKDLWVNNMYLNSEICFLSERADLYEKLIKVGCSDVIKSDICEYYFDRIKYNPKEKSLYKMLGVTKPRFEIMKNNQTTRAWRIVKDFDWVTDDDLKIIQKMNICNFELNKISEQKNPQRVLTYISNKNIKYSDYEHYIDALKYCGYDLNDKSYVYPKDFKKENDRVHIEYTKREAENEAKKYKENDSKIRAISDIIKQSKELKDYFMGAQGLQIFVPESVADLYMAGMKLHNCIGTYADRIAKRKTLVFLCRRIDKPDEEYVAFEYSNGKILQIREDHNKQCEQTTVLDFCSAFVKQLNKIQIMQRIAAA